MAMPVPHVSSGRIRPQDGVAVAMHAGAVLRVVCPDGGQVADIFAVPADDPRDGFSAGRTMDYAESHAIGAGAVLYSTRSRPLFTIVGDDVGRHDVLLSPCSAEMFARQGRGDGHPSCHGNLARVLAPYEVDDRTIVATFNAFMRVDVAPDGRLTVVPPAVRPGDAITLRAECDLIAGITACSAEVTNGGRFGPIDWELDACGPTESVRAGARR